jgi:hypothetical protein
LHHAIGFAGLPLGDPPCQSASEVRLRDSDATGGWLRPHRPLARCISISLRLLSPSLTPRAKRTTMGAEEARQSTRSNCACLLSFGGRLASRSSAASIILQDVPKMIRLSGKTGEVFCAASCTFCPITVSIHLPSGRALTTIHIGKSTPTVAP